MNEVLIANELTEPVPNVQSPTVEFFERSLFEDVLEMKSLKQVSEATAVDLEKLREQVYHCLFNQYQQVRGFNAKIDLENEQVYGVVELFLKQFYQHFRAAVADLNEVHPPLQVAYTLGKNAEKMKLLLDEFIKEIKTDLA